MADPAHEQTEDMLREIERRVRREYLRAYEETESKLSEYLSRFEAKDRAHAEAVRRGEETEKEHKRWRRGQILVGKRWQEMVDTLAEDYRNADRLAASIVNGYTPEAYALNHDYATFQVEQGSRVDTSYTLYDRATVERLLRDEPDLLPVARVDSAKDLAWNRRHVVSAVTQGVLQGESLDRVARRLRTVAGMDFRASMRTARTTMTSAQNAGRVDAYQRAQEMGIQVRKRWMAALDMRTRHTHRRLDGETVSMDERFSNGLHYPGDPYGEAGEVYNCRCTLVPDLPGVDYSADRISRLDGVSYEEWRSERATGVSDAQFEERVNYFSSCDDLNQMRNLLMNSGYGFMEISEMGNDVGRLRKACDSVYKSAWDAADEFRRKYNLPDGANNITEYAMYSVDREDVPQTLNRTSLFQRYSLLRLSGDVPDVVDELPGEGIPVYRAVKSANGLSAQAMHDMTRYDRDQYVGGGIFGDGIYMSSSKAGAESYGAGEEGSVLYAEIKSTARIVDFDAIDDMMLDEGQRGSDVSVFAAEMGYDVIRKRTNRNEEGEVYYCVLRRSALVVKR